MVFEFDVIFILNDFNFQMTLTLKYMTLKSFYLEQKSNLDIAKIMCVLKMRFLASTVQIIATVVVGTETQTDIQT